MGDPANAVRRIAIGRLIGFVLAVGLLLFAVLMAAEYVKLDRDLREWEAAKLVSVPVDFSKPGKVSIPFKQICEMSHGQAFYLSTKGMEHLDCEQAQRVFEGLKVTIAIHSADGREMQTHGYSYYDGDAQRFVLDRSFPFPIGDYEATVDVVVGAPSLKTIEQTLEAEYIFCGLERMVVDLLKTLAVVSGIVGLAIGFFVAQRFRRYGIWRKPTAI